MGGSRERTYAQYPSSRTSQKDAMIARHVRKINIRDNNLHLFSGVTFNSIEGNAVLFQDHVENKLATAANGALRLPADVDVENGPTS